MVLLYDSYVHNTIDKLHKVMYIILVIIDMYITLKCCYNLHVEKEVFFMSMTEERRKYLYDYHKKNMKRVPLDLQLSDYEELKAAAEKNGESVNGFIKQAITEKLERMN